MTSTRCASTVQGRPNGTRRVGVTVGKFNPPHLGHLHLITAGAREVDAVDDVLAGSLAFDHADILRAGVERARSKLEYTTLATTLAGPDFTLGELQHVYEVVWGQELQRANFRRKVLNTPGFVEATRTRRRGRTGGAPATVYRPGSGRALTPPMMRDDQ